MLADFRSLFWLVGKAIPEKFNSLSVIIVVRYQPGNASSVTNFLRHRRRNRHRRHRH